MLICFSIFSHIQYVDDDEDGQSEDADGSDSPKPFDKYEIKNVCSSKKLTF